MDFEKLYRSCYMQVYSYCLSLTRDAHLAEEITQDAFFRALTAERSVYTSPPDAEGETAPPESSGNGFAGRSQELTWLCAIAKNRFADEMRRRGRAARLDPGYAEAISVNGEPVADDDPAADAADRDMSVRIHRELNRLEEPYREVFNLRVFGELSFGQIGALCGKTENWARVTYHRARLKIRERIE